MSAAARATVAKPLALAAGPSNSAQGVGGWRRGAELIDALPYIDSITPEEKELVSPGSFLIAQ
jgi:hypothetical protein